MQGRVKVKVAGDQDNIHHKGLQARPQVPAKGVPLKTLQDMWASVRRLAS